MSVTEETSTGFICSADTNLGINVATLDAADVRVLALATGELVTRVDFRGVGLQTYKTGPAEIAAAFRRLADRIEEAHQ